MKVPSDLHGDLIIHLIDDCLFRETYFEQQEALIDHLRMNGHFDDARVIEADFEWVRYLLWKGNQVLSEMGLVHKIIDLGSRPIVTDWWGDSENPVEIYGRCDLSLLP